MYLTNYRSIVQILVHTPLLLNLATLQTFLCKVLDMKVAKEDICDIYNHVVSKGDKYIECQY